jgi:transcriptional antiterminator
MSQEIIFELLEKGKPLTKSQIVELTSISERAVYHALKQLMKYEEVKKIFSSPAPLYELKRKKKKRKKRFSSSSSKNN